MHVMFLPHVLTTLVYATPFFAKKKRKKFPVNTSGSPCDFCPSLQALSSPAISPLFVNFGFAHQSSKSLEINVLLPLDKHPVNARYLSRMFFSGTLHLQEKFS